jgi:hypothetical protein
MQSLELDNFFFGNNPGEETDKGQKIGFFTKAKFVSQFNNSQEALKLWGVMNYFARLSSLYNMNNDDLFKTITYNIRKFENVCKDFTRTVYATKRGKQVVSGYQKANLPKKSPLMLPGESALIESLISYRWDSLSKLQRDWVDWVFADGFDNIIRDLKAIYSVRWQILSKFAKITTKRLQRIRDLIPEKKTAKKANISRDDVLALLRDRRDPLDSFYAEISDIIPSADLIKSVEKLKLGTPSSEKDAIAMIKNSVAAVYAAVPELGIKGESNRKVETLTRSWDDIKRGLDATYAIISLTSKARSHMTSNAMRLPWNKMHGKIGYLVSTYCAIKKQMNVIDSLDKKIQNALPSILELPLNQARDVEFFVTELGAYIDYFFKIIEDRKKFDSNLPEGLDGPLGELHIEWEECK